MFIDIRAYIFIKKRALRRLIKTTGGSRNKSNGSPSGTSGISLSLIVRVVSNVVPAVVIVVADENQLRLGSFANSKCNAYHYVTHRAKGTSDTTSTTSKMHQVLESKIATSMILV